jgi:two-component system, NtrC family, nitrogen regulation response regulator NtrX
MNKILILEDNKKLAVFYKELLDNEGYNVKLTHNSTEFFEAYKYFPAELLILDIKLNNSELCGLKVFEKLISEKLLNSKVIVFSGEATRTEIAKSMQLGAYTFVEKTGEFNTQKFLADVRQAINLKIEEDKNKKLTSQNVSLRDKLTSENPFIGESDAIKRVKHLAKRFSKAQVDILILGETGTGKEVLANYIYQHSPRFGKPFITVNAGSITDSLIDSELYGHKKGAFTGALNDKQGYFEKADSGILFLDEIGNMNFDAQANILRATENKVVDVLGGNTVKIDVNILFASNKEPADMIEEGTFKEDLFYRLEGNTIRIPALRERGDDILLLAELFIKKYTEKYKVVNTCGIAGLKKLLKSYNWPGNVRELKKFFEYVFILHDVVDNDVIKEEFDKKLSGNLKQDSLLKMFRINHYNDAMDVFTKKFLEYKIVSANGNINEVADKIGLDKSTIYKLKKKLKF